MRVGAIGPALLAGALLASAPLLGCAGPEPGLEPVPRPDRAAFAATVLPILIEHCANPSCHGRPERALSLFAPLKFRADPARTWLVEPLSPGEIEHDYRATAALIDPRDPDGSLLLQKALARTYHGGGVTLEAEDVPHRALRAWIAAAEGAR